MSCAAGSGGVAGQRAAGAAEAVVERDGGGQRGEATGESYAQLVQDASAVAFEAEDVLGGEKDRLDALADGRQVGAAAVLVLAAGGGGGGGPRRGGGPRTAGPESFFSPARPAPG